MLMAPLSGKVVINIGVKIAGLRGPALTPGPAPPVGVVDL